MSFLFVLLIKTLFYNLFACVKLYIFVIEPSKILLNLLSIFCHCWGWQTKWLLAGKFWIIYDDEAHSGLTLGLYVMYLLSIWTGPRPCRVRLILTLGCVGLHGISAVSYCTDCWKSNPKVKYLITLFTNLYNDIHLHELTNVSRQRHKYVYVWLSLLIVDPDSH